MQCLHSNVIEITEDTRRLLEIFYVLHICIFTLCSNNKKNWLFCPSNLLANLPILLKRLFEKASLLTEKIFFLGINGKKNSQAMSLETVIAKNHEAFYFFLIRHFIT